MVRLRTLLIVSCSLLWCSVALSQNPCGEEDTSRASIQAILKDLESGLYTSIGNKQLERMGDGAALEVLCTHTLDQMSGEREATAIASLIALSFGHPEWVTRPEYKVPEVSAILLAYLPTVIKEPRDKTSLDGAREVVGRELAYVKQQGLASPK